MEELGWGGEAENDAAGVGESVQCNTPMKGRKRR